MGREKDIGAENRKAALYFIKPEDLANLQEIAQRRMSTAMEVLEDGKRKVFDDGTIQVHVVALDGDMLEKIGKDFKKPKTVSDTAEVG